MKRPMNIDMARASDSVACKTKNEMRGTCEDRVMTAAASPAATTIISPPTAAKHAASHVYSKTTSIRSKKAFVPRSSAASPYHGVKSASTSQTDVSFPPLALTRRIFPAKAILSYHAFRHLIQEERQLKQNLTPSLSNQTSSVTSPAMTPSPESHSGVTSPLPSFATAYHRHGGSHIKDTLPMRLADVKRHHDVNGTMMKRHDSPRMQVSAARRRRRKGVPFRSPQAMIGEDHVPGIVFKFSSGALAPSPGPNNTPPPSRKHGPPPPPARPALLPPTTGTPTTLPQTCILEENMVPSDATRGVLTEPTRSQAASCVDPLPSAMPSMNVTDQVTRSVKKKDRPPCTSKVEKLMADIQPEVLRKPWDYTRFELLNEPLPMDSESEAGTEAEISTTGGNKKQATNPSLDVVWEDAGRNAVNPVTAAPLNQHRRASSTEIGLTPHARSTSSRRRRSSMPLDCSLDVEEKAGKPASSSATSSTASSRASRSARRSSLSSAPLSSSSLRSSSTSRTGSHSTSSARNTQRRGSLPLNAILTPTTASAQTNHANATTKTVRPIMTKTKPAHPPKQKTLKMVNGHVVTTPAANARTLHARLPHRRSSSLAPSMSICADGQGNAQQCIRQCASCKATKTPYWRESWDNVNVLCNACGLRFAKFRRYCVKCNYVPRKDDKNGRCCPLCEGTWA